MILDNYREFLDKLIGDIEAQGIDVSGLELDHFGYQCSSDEDYDKLKPEFEKLGKLVSENVVGGRRVGIYELNSPLEYNGRKIPAVELIAPKAGQVCPSALEHAEFVIKESFEEFMKRYSDVDWLDSEINQPTFPMLKLKLSDLTQVKFHYEPVLEIVGKEKKNG
jgi:predicted metalloenzyme YecM